MTIGGMNFSDLIFYACSNVDRPESRSCVISEVDPVRCPCVRRPACVMSAFSETGLQRVRP